MHYYRYNQHADEHPVVKHTREHVVLTFLNLPGVDLVEKLHEYEDLESDGVVQQFLSW